MNVLTQILRRSPRSLTFCDRSGDPNAQHSEYRMSSAEWSELGKPEVIVVQITIPARRRS